MSYDDIDALVDVDAALVDVSYCRSGGRTPISWLRTRRAAITPICILWRRQDLNLRPVGYGPTELTRLLHSALKRRGRESNSRRLGYEPSWRMVTHNQHSPRFEVPSTGVEPARLAAIRFERIVSAIPTTRAICYTRLRNRRKFSETDLYPQPDSNR